MIELRIFFDDVAMEKQRAKQKAFLTVAFGCPNNYTEADMRTVHKPLVEKGLNDLHFDVIVKNLGTTLSDIYADAVLAE